MTTKVQKWGNSLAIRISKATALRLGISENSPVTLREEKNSLVITKNKEVKYSLEELLKNFDPKTQHELVDWGKPRGKEVW